MPDCCAWHRTGGRELMACNNSDAQGFVLSAVLRTYEQGMIDGRKAAAAESRGLTQELADLLSTFRRHGGGNDVYASHVAGARLAAIRARAGLAEDTAESREGEQVVQATPETRDAPARDRVRVLVEKQANDEALWCETRSVEVAYLQQALRALHAAVEA